MKSFDLGQIVYVRHGQASLFSDNYDQLSPLGHRQSRAIGSYFSKKEIEFDRIFLGPLNRHKETLEGIIMHCHRLKDLQIDVLKGLKEHQGYKSLKALLPDLIKKDKAMRTLVNLPFNNKEEQIRHHMRIYNHFATRWANGEFDDDLKGKFQSWKEFYENATETYNNIWDSTSQGERVLVITSGGPTSVAYGIERGLSYEEILSFSSSLFNGSMTTFVLQENINKIKEANSISHFPEKDLHTLV